ncbi:MAG: hypothetical protein VCB42_07110 [Myxococcota bacterium]
MRPIPGTGGRRHGRPGGLMAAGLLMLAGCGAEHPNILECKDEGAVHAICGIRNVEDLAAIPNRSIVLLGQGYGLEEEGGGSIALFDPADESVSTAYRGGAGDETASPEPVWGDADCPGAPPASFSPHGIDLAPLPDGRLRLLVVNHGGRESIEFFEVVDRAGEPAVLWRGCAIPPETAYLNDVAGLPDGGLVTSHMMEMGTHFSGTLRGLLGLNTGFVYGWQPGGEFEPLPGTEGSLPNGLQVSPDGNTLYLNLYLANRLRVLDRRTGEILETLDIPQPDNLTWAKNGHLLVASHLGSVGDSVACMQLSEGACGMPFQIVSVDPANLSSRTIFSQSGPPMGAGTTALDLGGELLIGSFSSDRLLRVPARP